MKMQEHGRFETFGPQNRIIALVVPLVLWSECQLNHTTGPLATGLSLIQPRSLERRPTIWLPGPGLPSPG